MDFKDFDIERTANCEQRDRLSELTDAQRQELIITTIGHILEEVIEFRQHWPRRAWRNDEISPFVDDEKYHSALIEFIDIILLLGNVAKYAKYDSEIIENAIEEKRRYNEKRLDHKARDERQGD